MLGQQQVAGDVIGPADADAGKVGEFEGVESAGFDGEGFEVEGFMQSEGR